jgi:hypothetical protein
MKKIRASYSFLNEWSRGNTQQALLNYFHVPTPTPRNYINGKAWDTYATEYVKKHARLPLEWGEVKLVKPVPQVKHLVDYNAIGTITGVFDIYEPRGVITELKSGHSLSARQYARTMQIPLYFLICEIAGIKADIAQIIRYNPRTDSSDTALVYPSDKMLLKARNYLDTLLPEIHHFFEVNNLFGKTDEEMKELLVF